MLFKKMAQVWIEISANLKSKQNRKSLLLTQIIFLYSEPIFITKHIILIWYFTFRKV